MTGGEVEFRLLGPLEVRRDGVEVRLGGPRERAVLAALLLRPNKVASVGCLVDAVWERPPASPETNLRTYVSGLRRRLGPERLVTRPGGYLLEVRPGELDLHAFTEASDRGRAALVRGDLKEAIKAFEQALRQWRDEPLTGESYGAGMRTETVRLTEARIEALSGYARAKLDSGAAVDVIGELSRFAGRYPLHEELWALLVEARYGAGQRAEALETYTRARTRLRDELGVEPGPRLRETHAAILRDEPDRRPPRPAQLPADLSTFTGRETELDHLDRLLAGPRTAVVISAIDGMAGIGKTALAVHLAHRTRDRFPDGQLFLDLHGYTEGIDPVAPSDALDRMLRALGVPDQRIPHGVDERSALYRSTLADRRMLILLDNAATADQVEPLLPGSPGCAALITSRRRLAGLDHAVPLSLDVLPQPDAVELFTRIAGSADTELVDNMVGLCGHLPLAIQIAAARLRSRPGWTVAHLADRLRDEQRRFTELTTGERSMSAAFGLSYQHLPEDQRRVFRLLGLHPGPDLDLYAAAALTGLEIPRIGRCLEALLDAHMLLQHTPDRYHFHDLLRGYAAAAAVAEESDGERHAALTRLLDHYVRTATGAVDALYPHRAHERPRPPDVPVSGPVLHTAAKATEWLDAELPNLLGAVTCGANDAWHDHAIRLYRILYRHLRTRCYPVELDALGRTVLRIARLDGARRAEILALRGIGAAAFHLSNLSEALSSYQEALDLAVEIGDLDDQVWAQRGLGKVHRRAGRPGRAIECYLAAVEAAQRTGNRAELVETLLNLGNVHVELGRTDDAADAYRTSMALAQEVGDPMGEAHATDGLGIIEEMRGRHDEACRYHDRALAIARRIGTPLVEIQALTGLGISHRSAGRYQQSAEYYRLTVRLAVEHGFHNGRFEALHGLGRTLRATGDATGALACQRDAIELAITLRQPRDAGRAHIEAGSCELARDDREAAAQHWRHALTILREIDAPEADEAAAHLAQIDGTATATGSGQAARSGVS